MNRGYSYCEQLGPSARGKTCLAYLVGRYPHSSDAEWLVRLDGGEVLLDGVTANPSAILRSGQRLQWNRPPWDEPEVPRHFEPVHEDEAILAVAKPSGLPTLPGGGYFENTLLTLVQAQTPGAIPVHRLGRGTSGLVLFAKTAGAASKLSKAWRDRSVGKRYRALAMGRAAKDQYEISAPIGLVPHPRLGRVHAYSERGKPSRSSARVLERWDGQTLFQVDIETGRPDQIRIHLAFIGHPLSGDSFFIPGGTPRLDAPGLPGDGGYLLHGERLCFQHPESGVPLTLSAPVPPGLRRGLFP
ncbi:MAG: pseudouridine synthase [Myxococcaceae bacterium]